MLSVCISLSLAALVSLSVFVQSSWSRALSPFVKGRGRGSGGYCCCCCCCHHLRLTQKCGLFITCFLPLRTQGFNGKARSSFIFTGDKLLDRCYITENDFRGKQILRQSESDTTRDVHVGVCGAGGDRNSTDLSSICTAAFSFQFRFIAYDVCHTLCT